MACPWIKRTNALVVSRLLILLLVMMCVKCEWIQVPLRTRDPQLEDSFEIEQNRQQTSRISDKLESLAIALRVDSNHTRQMDITLDQSTTRRRNDRPVAVKKDKTRISEPPFSIFGFLRSIRDSFFFKSQGSVKQKVGFLERIRDSIMAGIKQRILDLFPIMRRRLSKRDIESHEHGHDFVSADGALVTICFLTFSVFLIKLVLQIIYILKKKHYSMSPGGDGTVGAVRRLIKKNQHARKIDIDEDEDDALQYFDVMRAINNAPK